MLGVHVVRCEHPLNHTAYLACHSFFLWAPEIYVQIPCFVSSCHGQAAPLLLVLCEAQKVLFLPTLCMLWLELLTPSSMESRPRRESIMPWEGAEGILVFEPSLSLPGHPSCPA